MSALLSLLVPGWIHAAAATAAALSGLFAFLWLKGKSAQAQLAHEERHEARAIAENHAVEQHEAAATTDGEADAALDAAAHADHS